MTRIVFSSVEDYQLLDYDNCRRNEIDMGYRLFIFLTFVVYTSIFFSFFKLPEIASLIFRSKSKEKGNIVLIAFSVQCRSDKCR